MITLFISFTVIGIGGGAFCYGFNRMHKLRLIQDTPRSKIRSMAMGLVEIHGFAHPQKIIKTPFSRTDCVYYHYEIKEYRMHTFRDSKGKTHTTYSWDTIATGERRIPFFTKDETGKVYVDPQGAEINLSIKRQFYQKTGIFRGFNTLLTVLNNWTRTEKDFDIDSLQLTPMELGKRIMFSTVGDRKYFEYFIEPDESLFVLGTAFNKENKVLIKKGENEPTFIISNKSEKELLKKLKWSMILSFILSIILIIVGIIMIIGII